VPFYFLATRTIAKGNRLTKHELRASGSPSWTGISSAVMEIAKTRDSARTISVEKHSSRFRWRLQHDERSLSREQPGSTYQIL